MATKGNKSKTPRFKASNLYRLLPDETIQGLKEGTVDVDRVANELVYKRQSKAFGDATQQALIWQRSAATGFAKMAFGVNSSDKVQNHQVSIDIVRLARELWIAFGHELDKSRVSSILAKYDCVVRAFQQTHDCLLEKWAPRILQITGHHPAHNSPMYQTTFDHFSSMMAHFTNIPEHMEQQANNFCAEKISAMAACRGVAIGFDLIQLKCWECGVDNKDVFKCQGCDAARYCGFECQKKSWKEGHKLRCKVLKLQHALFQCNSKVITRALKEGSIAPSSTIAPNPSFDYQAICEVFHAVEEFSCNKDGYSLNRITAGACMTEVYKWIHDLEDGGSHFALSEHGQANSSDSINSGATEEPTEAELVYVAYTIMTMAERWYKEDTLHQFKMFLGGNLMSTKRFLEIYKTHRDRTFEGIPALSCWDAYASLLFQELLSEYHKS
ncbi:unknown protein [Seminavis robusta]|uniref:MYND-type domain-containing protein n=1 Tax=Seminavis robusta TaxID=568900 RepID=A0A9N8DIF6_9STRA|nr:unknown protein [Seminavis robusta]|eukprot:Sro103_g052300.1 n/a (441) ;mRNA; r:9054-10376